MDHGVLVTKKWDITYHEWEELLHLDDIEADVLGEKYIENNAFFNEMMPPQVFIWFSEEEYDGKLNVEYDTIFSEN